MGREDKQAQAGPDLEGGGDVTSIYTTIQVPGLGLSHQKTLDKLMAQLGAKAPRNRLRRRYYEHKAALKDLGIAIPPQLRTVESVVGWPSKAVDSLSRRTVLDGFTSPEVAVEDLGLVDLMRDNRMDAEAAQAHTSTLIHSVSFVSTTSGDVAAGEPEVLVSAFSAEDCTGIWDYSRRALSAALTVVSRDSMGIVNHMVMHLPGLAIIMRRDGQRWDLRQSEHDLDVPVEPLVYRPALNRPFGSSMISRAVMSITDTAVRTALRTEVSAEFYSAPQRYVLGADDQAFQDGDGNPIPAWQSVLGRMLALGLDEEGNKPEVGQFSQQSMEPHLAQMRELATRFAGETNLPVGVLGVVQDNPSSAEALYAAKEELVIDSTHWATLSLAPAWERTAVNALRLIDDTPAARETYRTLRAHWKNPATPSIVSASDAMVKQVTAIPRIAETDVALERLGYSPDEIDRMKADWIKAQGKATIAGLRPPPAEPEVTPNAEPV